MSSETSNDGGRAPRRPADLFSDLPELTTGRLLLRPLRAEDAADMYEYARDPEVSRFTVWEPPTDVRESRAFIECILDDYRRGDPSPWGMVDMTDGKLIGTCGYFFWDPEHARAEIHYAMSRTRWGKGLMTEAVATVIGFGFDVMGLHRVEARCIPGNTASERVMQKCGMVFEGVMREALFAKGSFHDLKSYAVLRQEFRRPDM